MVKKSFICNVWGAANTFEKLVAPSLGLAIRTVDILLEVGDDLLALQFLCGSREALSEKMVGHKNQMKRFRLELLTFCGFHSSSDMTTPSMISMPRRPPALPAC